MRPNATLRGAIAVATAVLLTVVGVVPASAQVLIETADLNQNGVIDAWGYDDDADGGVDRLLIDANERATAEVIIYANRGQIVVIHIDANLDDILDTAYVPYYADAVAVGLMLWRDVDQNGAWENAYYDGQLDSYFEWVYVDTNFDGAGDTWRANAAPAGRSASDEAARQVAALSAFQNLQAGNVPIFGPLAWPIGG